MISRDVPEDSNLVVAWSCLCQGTGDVAPCSEALDKLGRRAECGREHGQFPTWAHSARDVSVGHQDGSAAGSVRTTPGFVWLLDEHRGMPENSVRFYFALIKR